MNWTALLILLIVSAVLCSVGFYKHVYFLSIGYGFSVAGIGIALLCMYTAKMNVISAVQCFLLILYGVRLSGFLIYRESRNVVYRNTLKSVSKDESAMSFLAKYGIWVGASFLYVAETCPVFFRLNNGASDIVMPVLGIVISLIGLFMEAIADHQKSVQKKVNSHMAATEGLYRLVRCPNYLGEILFWTGIMFGGITSIHGIGQWFLAVLAYATIFAVMVSGADRLRKRQDSRYMKYPEYQAYIAKTPVLFPFTKPIQPTKEDHDSTGR